MAELEGPMMDEAVRKNEMLGLRVKRLRRKNGWTLAELARRANLATSTLSKVENNQLSLTYNNLTKLAAGLGVDIANLFTDDVIAERSEKIEVKRRGDGLHQKTQNFDHEFLFEALLHKAMVPIITEVRTSAIEEFGDWDQHDGEEFIFVLEGSVEIHVGSSTPVRLRAGDSCYFDAKFPHAAINVGRNSAYILSVTTAPEKS
ncbi:MAG: helix-turn-helix domain-containing protein [Parvibaculaceae bacterium]